ncbi:SpaA isopeptide-forming pilin-related protein [Microbacterium hydrocarbonoxydans]|uniref:Conserved repeat domain-containing protein/fimbrial isopeptide formation D2 domain-containing protein n=1 Tax=Microbacterium hydrocarbonoxydans TaxID=273678 RepID=A0A1H4J0X3_9MICO|nr:SpaA isopeptide-forming pilin-related protein [Microbacterium hydrocarbonoxydans]SEB39212.1 conserved repeat domain-containing protein/fimbrial isopeptide formation D2 domain-containing protein [Microbacterium hydrocarbonoxydans]
MRRAGSALLAVAAVGGGTLVPAVAAQAATVYEIEGEWQAPVPTEVTYGDPLVSVWRFNINDDSPAPTNEPVDNVTLTFTVQNARFTTVPDVCLATGVTPVSSISADGTTLVCNVGTRDQGTAELMLTGLEARGDSGTAVSITGSLGAVQAALPEIPIVNEFAMDMKFDGGKPDNTQAGARQQMAFPWALRHASGSTPGPNTVSYNLTFSTTGGETVTPQVAGCTEQSIKQAGYPYSGTGHAANETAPFPATCTLVSTGTNRMRLTLTGIDYSKTVLPSQDSGGGELEPGWDVVAAGLVNIQFTYINRTTVTVVSSAPVYTSTVGETSADAAANNTNALAATRGDWTGGWALGSLNPPQPGSTWTDTYRAMAGGPARQTAGVRTPNVGATQSTQICSIVDSRYVNVVDAKMGTVTDGVVAPYAGITYWYYTGTGVSNNMNPTHANYDPNTFVCDGSTGWTTVKPADMSTVRAVKAIVSPAAGAAIGESIARLYVDSTVKPTVAVGQDIWTWTSYSVNGGTSWFNLNRSLNAADVPANGTVTPDSRYPYTSGGRDVLRIIAATPAITKSVDQRETIPGATVTYTLTYRANAALSATVPSVAVSDVLPAGMQYVAGSASVAPTSISGQTLNWTFANVQTNTDYVITLSARIPADADPGDVYENTATTTVAGVTATATAETKIRDGGYTMLTKTAAEAKVPHVQGVASDSWTVRISSQDTRTQTFTDVVDVLPYNGDGRGTDFSGSYALSGPVTAVAGAKVYYTTAAPATLVDDPADASNGAAGSITGNTVGWSTTFTANATGVRVIGPALAPSSAQEFVIPVVTSGATFEDVYVNRAEARSDRTELVMRTSSRFEIGAVNSVALKKYVQDADGEWHDANDIDDFPQMHTGDTVTYRLVVTNTGDQTLHDLVITDDKVDLASLDPLPAGLEPGAIIAELLPGAENAVTIEYQVPLTAMPDGGQLVNTACVVPEDTTPPAPGEPAPVEESCDPAGITVLPSSLTWEKIAEGSEVPLAGSEWQLTPVDANDAPTGAAIDVVDCVAANATGCTGRDIAPEAGVLTVNPLTDGRYRLVETKAPAGYQLDPTPHYIDVVGETTFEDPIENVQSEVPTIPLTGGMGSDLFWITAGALATAAIGGLLWQRRRRRTRD